MNKELIDLESKPCPLGCSSNDRKVLSGKDFINNLPGEFWVVRCNICGLMRTNPRPSPISMSFYYPNNYRPHKNKNNKTLVMPCLFRGFYVGIINRIFQKFNNFTTILPDVVPSRALEVGCASGSFMKTLKSKGWEVEGLEFSPFAAKNARNLGFEVHTGALESAPDPKAPYDLIVGWMVLEHLHDPIEGLKKLHRWSSPDGWLTISVPNAASAEFSIFKSFWYALQLPTHLYHFTPETIEKLLSKAGWKVEKVFHQRILNNLLGSLGLCLRRYKLTKNIGRKFCDLQFCLFINYLLFPLAYILAAIGQTGRMTVWARKTNAEGLSTPK